MGESTPKPLLSDGVYRRLKFLSLVVLPGVATLYFALAGLWDLPNPDKVVGTITAVNTFYGLLLTYSTYRYNNSAAKYDGAIVEVPDVANGGTTFVLKPKGLPEDLYVNKKEVTFRIDLV